MHLYVVRHGSTYNNVNGLINGRNDIDINDKGIEDAKIASLILQDISFDRVISSPLLRAKHTADIIVNGRLPISYDERITERDAGVMKALEVCIFGYPGIDGIKNWQYSNGTVRNYNL